MSRPHVPPADLSEDATRALVKAMREVARTDGVHPAEEQLIDELAAGLEVSEGAPDLSSLDSPAAQETFVKTLLLVGFADGQLSDAECGVIRGYAEALGLGEKELARCTTDVAEMLLSQLSGVQVFREQAVAIGQQLGLDRFTIEHVLDEDRG